MVIAYLTGNTDQNPYKLFCDSVEAGYYHGAGWSHGTLSRYAAEYGVQTRWIANDGEAVLQALREGKPVIAHMGPGHFHRKGTLSGAAGRDGGRAGADERPQQPEQLRQGLSHGNPAEAGENLHGLSGVLGWRKPLRKNSRKNACGAI